LSRPQTTEGWQPGTAPCNSLMTRSDVHREQGRRCLFGLRRKRRATNYRKHDISSLDRCFTAASKFSPKNALTGRHRRGRAWIDFGF
jgi:hypothetical protein